ncbi:MAG: flagellar biosynthesis protein FlhA [Hyphomicrobiaceae bacterium]
MATPAATTTAPALRAGNQDVAFALAIILILTVLFLPLPPILVDLGLALSIALSVVILMVALWIQRPIEFSAFPTVLLIATLLRLALNIATTRLILSNGASGHDAAGHVIAGFASFVMSGDFVIGVIVFIILITINFVVITKGATRIAEVGARFTLDAIPGKQMAIDADLAAGAIDEREATRRRRELEEESAFFGAMDGASKFVRGDAIAGLIILIVNVVGGVLIGVIRHELSLVQAVDVFVKLSVGDGLVTQIPALIVALAAGLIVSKGGTRGSAEKAVFGQLGSYPRALTVAGAVMLLLGFAPGLPFLPFAMLGGVLVLVANSITQKRAEVKAQAEAVAEESQRKAAEEVRNSVKESLKTSEIELRLGKQIASAFLTQHTDLVQRVSNMRRRFAEEYGFVVPDIKLSDDLSIPAKSYQIRIHGTAVTAQELRIGDVLVVIGDGPRPDIPGDEVREPAFGMKAMWVSEMFVPNLKREGFTPVDNISVLLTHLREIVRGNLAQLLSYKDMRGLLDRLDPEYRRLLDEIAPTHISYSGLQAVLKLLLAERVSVRNLHLILEAIAEIAPHVRRTDHIAEHVRTRLAQQICGDIAENGVLKVLRLGNRWELAFHQSLKRDAKGEVMEFEIDPRQIEQFSNEATSVIRNLLDQGHAFALVTAPDARPYVRMVTERIFPTLPVLSHLEIARGVQIKTLGTLS